MYQTNKMSFVVEKHCLFKTESNPEFFKKRIEQLPFNDTSNDTVATMKRAVICSAGWAEEVKVSFSSQF